LFIVVCLWVLNDGAKVRLFPQTCKRIMEKQQKAVGFAENVAGFSQKAVGFA
jgi:hypothetical protein